MGDRLRKLIKMGMMSSGGKPWVTETLTIQPDEIDGVEAFINSKLASNYSTLQYFRVGQPTSDQAYIARTLLKMSGISNIPDDAVISGATLKISVGDNSEVSKVSTIKIYRLKRAWVKNQVTWNIWKTGSNWSAAGGFGADDCEQTEIGSLALAANHANGTVVEIPITAATKADLDLGNGWLIKSDSEDDDAYAWNGCRSIVSTSRPKLEVTYSTQNPVGAPAATRVRLTIPVSVVGDPNEATHPDVYYNAAGWNGFDYWMAMTPYHVDGGNSDETVENPEILCSADGVTWAVPTGGTNPIDAAPVAPAHNSDTDIIVDGSANMWCYYRESDNATYETIKVRSSSDGVTWSAEADLFSTAGAALAVSPAVVFDGTNYRMFTINNVANTLGYRTCATPNGVWSAESACTVNGLAANWKLWHLDVVLDGATWIAYIVLRYLKKGQSRLFKATSADGITWTLETLPTLSPSVSGWDNDRIYRASPVKIGSAWRLYYSAKSIDDVWGIGYIDL